MNELYIKALEAYTSMLQIHIDTKTMDSDFHAMTEEFYEKLFDVAHQIGEKHVDLGGKHEATTLEQKMKEANEIIINLRKDIEAYHGSNDITLGTEDLLGSLANDLEDIEGSSRSFLK